MPPDQRHAVLITRAAGAADRTAERIRALGLVPVLAPLMVVRSGRVAWPGRIDAVLITSANALPALAAMPDAPLLTVGDATADRARAAGLHRVESAGADAAALLELATRRLAPGARLVLAAGARQGHALTAGLRAAGFAVHRRAAYDARPVPRLPPAAANAIGAGTLRAALFLSAETARTFARLLPPALAPALAGTDALAIAQNAADALTPLPWRRVRVSVAPTLDQVLALL